MVDREWAREEAERIAEEAGRRHAARECHEDLVACIYSVMAEVEWEVSLIMARIRQKERQAKRG